MRTLAIETASEACSVALFAADDELIAHNHQTIGRGHAEALVPMIAALPDKGKAARILVSLGPGSFTGVRIGLATARALAVAWGADVAGYPTLALIAAMALAKHPDEPVTVCINGGHGEWFVQDFTAHGRPQDNACSVTPVAAAARPGHVLVAGNRAFQWADQRPRTEPDPRPFEVLPDARCALMIAGELFRADLAPIYGRGPDATPSVPTGSAP